MACTTADAAAGVVAVRVEADGAIRLTCGASGPPPPPGDAPQLIINEVDYDQVGTDDGGFVEIANVGTGAAELAGIALVLVNGDGTEYGRVPLTGSLAAGGYLAVQAELQNGAPDGVALVDATRGVTLDVLSYEGEIRAAAIDGRTVDLVEGTPLPVGVADSNTMAGSLARLPDRTDTGSAAADWAFTTTVTPGAANVATG